MAEEPEKPADMVILGLAAYGRAVNSLAGHAARGAVVFVERNCLPAVRKAAVLIKDGLTRWTGTPAEENGHPPPPAAIPAPAAPVPAAACDHAPAPAHDHDHDHAHAHEQWEDLVGADHSSDEDDPVLDLLAKLSPGEARLLDYVSRRCGKILMPSGLVEAHDLVCTHGQLREASGLDDIAGALAHLRELDLLAPDPGVFEAGATGRLAAVTPTALGLSLYVRCQDVSEPPAVFFRLVPAGT